MEKLNYVFRVVNIREISESPLNAQVMEEEDFNRLVENLRKDKILTSSVLLMRYGENGLMCISGHHRIKAAKKAGIKEVPALIIDEVDESTRVRLQLAHNDIHGTPDENIVRILQDKLNEFDIKLVDFKDIEPIRFDHKDIKFVDFKYLSVCLKPESFEELDELIKSYADTADSKYLIPAEDYSFMQDLLTVAFRKGYKTPGKAFRKFLDIIKEHEKEIVQ